MRAAYYAIWPGDSGQDRLAQQGYVDHTCIVLLPFVTNSHTG
jgi:hypothetical protein